LWLLRSGALQPRFSGVCRRHAAELMANVLPDGSGTSADNRKHVATKHEATRRIERRVRQSSRGLAPVLFLASGALAFIFLRRRWR
jgi:hypothetical protein